MSFDQAKMWQALEDRLAVTENPRHRQMLQTVIDHAKAEAARDLDRMMATLVDDPQMHNWSNGRDHGPKGLKAVTEYYRNFCTSGGAVFESPKDRVVVDDHNIATEANVTNFVSGKIAKARGYTVPDESGHYAVRFRNVIFFAFGEDPTRALSEDSNTSFDPDAWERVADADLPQQYLDYLAELSVAK
jgi:hypothetical protein